MKSIDVLMTGAMMPLVVDGLDAAFTLHRLHAVPDKDAFLAEVGPRIRAVATGGHARMDGAFMQRLPGLEIIANFGVGYDSVDAVWAGRNGIVVTQETSAAEKRNPRRPMFIPDVCREMGVPCVSLLGLMRREGWVP